MSPPQALGKELLARGGDQRDFPLDIGVEPPSTGVIPLIVGVVAITPEMTKLRFDGEDLPAAAARDLREGRPSVADFQRRMNPLLGTAVQVGQQISAGGDGINTVRATGKYPGKPPPTVPYLLARDGELEKWVVLVVIQVAQGIDGVKLAKPPRKYIGELLPTRSDDLVADIPFINRVVMADLEFARGGDDVEPSRTSSERVATFVPVHVERLLPAIGAVGHYDRAVQDGPADLEEVDWGGPQVGVDGWSLGVARRVPPGWPSVARCGAGALQLCSGGVLDPLRSKKRNRLGFHPMLVARPRAEIPAAARVGDDDPTLVVRGCEIGDEVAARGDGVRPVAVPGVDDDLHVRRRDVLDKRLSSSGQ